MNLTYIILFCSKTVKEEDQKDDVVKDDAEADLPKASLPSSDKTYTKWR